MEQSSFTSVVRCSRYKVADIFTRLLPHRCIDVMYSTSVILKVSVSLSVTERKREHEGEREGSGMVSLQGSRD